MMLHEMKERWHQTDTEIRETKSQWLDQQADIKLTLLRPAAVNHMSHDQAPSVFHMSQLCVCIFGCSIISHIQTTCSIPVMSLHTTTILYSAKIMKNIITWNVTFCINQIHLIFFFIFNSLLQSTSCLRRHYRLTINCCSFLPLQASCWPPLFQHSYAHCSSYKFLRVSILEATLTQLTGSTCYSIECTQQPGGLAAAFILLGLPL